MRVVCEGLPDYASTIRQPFTFGLLDPLSNVQTTVYDSDTGQVIERKDAKNVSTYFEYDDLGRQSEITDRLGEITTRAYDSAGRLESITDAQNKTTSYDYNLLGQRTEVTLPDSTTKEFEYDPAGRLKKVILESGISQTTVYEFSGVVDKIEYRNAGNTLVGTDDYTYNALLRRTGASGRYGSTQAWTYDDLGRMITESLTYNSQTYPVGYHYDSRGRLDEITYPSGRKAEYSFDERSALDTITWDSSEIEDRDYDDLGRLDSVDRPGVDETRAYDDAGRLTSIANTNVGTATYTYDANHNKLSESWSGAMAAWNFVTTNAGTYTDGYDHEDRFVHFAQSSQSKTFNFTRSDIGNITNVNLNGTGTSRGFNNIHALTSIGAASQTFDVDGNQTASWAGHTMSWDEAGMMKQSVVPTSPVVGEEGTNEYGYDADRKRIWKKISRVLLRNDPPSVVEHKVYIYAGPNCIAEYPAGTAAASPTQEYVYAQEIDSLVMLVRNGGSDKYAITRNQQWSVTALTNASNGTVLERYTYDHFGKRTILAPDGSTVRSTSTYHMPYGYTSRRHDAETGLMYFRARYFDPHTAEFISPDPLEYVDGMSLFRGYFVIRSTDPFGLYYEEHIITTGLEYIRKLGRGAGMITRHKKSNAGSNRVREWKQSDCCHCAEISESKIRIVNVYTYLPHSFEVIGKGMTTQGFLNSLDHEARRRKVYHLAYKAYFAPVNYSLPFKCGTVCHPKKGVAAIALYLYLAENQAIAEDAFDEYVLIEQVGIEKENDERLDENGTNVEESGKDFDHFGYIHPIGDPPAIEWFPCPEFSCDTSKPKPLEPTKQ